MMMMMNNLNKTKETITRPNLQSDIDPMGNASSKGRLDKQSQKIAVAFNEIEKKDGGKEECDCKQGLCWQADCPSCGNKN